MNEHVPGIEVAELGTVLRAGGVLFDVRERDEYLEAHVGGGMLIPLQTVPSRVDEFPTDQRVYLICASGGRSHQAAAFLRQRGVDAVNVLGGTSAWIAAGFAIECGPDAGPAA